MLVRWPEIKKYIKDINVLLFDVLEHVEGIEDFEFEILEYPYGAIIADEHNFYLPCGEKKDRVPFLMILENKIEMFIDFKDKSSTFKIYSPGEYLGISAFYRAENNHHPGDLLQLSSGARNAFMLCPVSEEVHHNNIKKHFGVDVPKPSTLSSHYHSLKQIADSSDCTWRSKLLVFPKEISDLLSARQLPELHNLLLEYDIEQYGYYSNIPFYNYLLHHIKHNDSDISSNTFINDAISQIFTICVNQMPGYALAMDESMLPLQLFIDIYKDIYKTKYIPFVFQPEYFSTKLPVYYSVSKEEMAFKPEVFSNQPQKCFQLFNSYNRYIDEILTLSLFKGTRFFEIAENVRLTMFNEKKVQEGYQKYFHQPVDSILDYDPRFKQYINIYDLSGFEFPVKTGFFTGCFGLKDERS